MAGAPIASSKPLGPTTSNRKWRCEVTPRIPGIVGEYPADTPWLRLRGVREFKPNPGTVEMTDMSDMDGEGFTASEAFSGGWGGEGKVRRGTDVNEDGDPIYDEAQELIRIAGQAPGLSNVIHVRMYELEDNGPRIQAIEGDANATWTEEGGDSKAASEASFTLVGNGKPTRIAHPAG